MRPFLLLLAMLTACSSCAHWSTRREPFEQHNAMVKIVTTCITGKAMGTGVMVSPDRVLTAAHVIECEIVPGIMQTPIKIEVFASDVDYSDASVEIVVTGGDVARLQLDRPMPAYFTDVRIGAPPVIGDKVCEASAVPRVTYRCGIAQHSPSGYIFVDFSVEHGNSGSGMYNEVGELIGIITNLRRCQDNVACAGWGTALAGYAWLLPES